MISPARCRINDRLYSRQCHRYRKFLESAYIKSSTARLKAICEIHSGLRSRLLPGLSTSSTPQLIASPSVHIKLANGSWEGPRAVFPMGSVVITIAEASVDGRVAIDGITLHELHRLLYVLSSMSPGDSPTALIESAGPPLDIYERMRWFAGVHHLAADLGCTEAKTLMLRELEALLTHEGDAVVWLVCACRLRMMDWLWHGLNTYARRSERPTAIEKTRLGPEVALKLYDLQDSYAKSEEPEDVTECDVEVISGVRGTKRCITHNKRWSTASDPNRMCPQTPEWAPEREEHDFSDAIWAIFGVPSPNESPEQTKGDDMVVVGDLSKDVFATFKYLVL